MEINKDLFVVGTYLRFLFLTGNNKNIKIGIQELESIEDGYYFCIFVVAYKIDEYYYMLRTVKSNIVFEKDRVDITSYYSLDYTLYSGDIDEFYENYLEEDMLDEEIGDMEVIDTFKLSDTYGIKYLLHFVNGRIIETARVNEYFRLANNIPYGTKFIKMRKCERQLYNLARKRTRGR